MSDRINQGYLITSSVHIGESEYVLGVNVKAPSQFVTWKCSNGNDYVWGHYFSDLFAAEKDLIMRAQEEIEYLEQSHKLKEPRRSKRRARDDAR